MIYEVIVRFGGRYVVSATKKWGHSSRPLWCLSATDGYDLLLPFGSLYEAVPDLGSSIHANTLTPQLRKKRDKRMKRKKGRSIVVSSPGPQH